LFIHDLKELIDGHNDYKLKNANHGTGMITRTILIILVIGIAIKIYNKPPWPKRETEPLPNQIKCNQIEGE